MLCFRAAAIFNGHRLWMFLFALSLTYNIYRDATCHTAPRATTICPSCQTPICPSCQTPICPSCQTPICPICPSCQRDGNGLSAKSSQDTLHATASLADSTAAPSSSCSSAPQKPFSFGSSVTSVLLQVGMWQNPITCDPPSCHVIGFEPNLDHFSAPGYVRGFRINRAHFFQLHAGIAPQTSLLCPRLYPIAQDCTLHRLQARATHFARSNRDTICMATFHISVNMGESVR